MIIMEENIEWVNIKKKQKKILFNKYIIDKIDENNKNMENGVIDKLIYSKNNFFLKTLKINDEYYKNIKEEDIIIKNNVINEIINLEINEDGLFYLLNNKWKQTKITDFKINRKNIKNSNQTLKM